MFSCCFVLCFLQELPSCEAFKCLCRHWEGLLLPVSCCSSAVTSPSLLLMLKRYNRRHSLCFSSNRPAALHNESSHWFMQKATFTWAFIEREKWKIYDQYLLFLKIQLSLTKALYFFKTDKNILVKLKNYFMLKPAWHFILNSKYHSVFSYWLV